MLHLQKPVEDYILFFQNLSARSVNLLDQLTIDDVVFRDPFQDVRGREKMKDIFHHMFQVSKNPRFRVVDRAFGSDGMTVYLKWRFSAETKIGKLDFEGMSEVTFDSQGKVIAHIDFWDSATEFYNKIPILRPFFTFLRKKAAATS